MPLRDFTCKSCQMTQERFYWASSGFPVCTCGGELEVLPLQAPLRDHSTGLFPHVTTHLTGDGKPIQVDSLSHLRKLEKQYGVIVHQFSNNRGNPDSPRDLPKFRGGDHG
jgi:hypothetical protein